MSDEFLNGYHFVPRKAPDNEGWLEGQGEIERDLGPYDGAKAARFGLTPGTFTDGHAVYAPGRHSGRITCTARLECPTVIGARRHSGGENARRYAVVEPFLYKSRPAIPATSLKGLISSTAEAASRSAYRALGDSILTVAYSPEGDPTRNWDHATSGIRGGIGSTHDYFRDVENADPGKRDNPLPFTLTRSEVSPAEAMFGYVRNNESGKPAKNRLVAVAGKLRFSLAVPSGTWAAKETAEFFVAATSFEGEDYSSARRGRGYVRLKEMGEPMKKPQGLKGPRKFIDANLRSATPTMYFLKKDNPASPISKKEFGETAPAAFRAQGGKFYLHHVDAAAGEPWATKVSVEADHDAGSGGPAAGRKSAVRPLRAGITFRFHVDFDNLTDRELNLLCFALQPSTAFRHKIGMGKGIGLGSIEIVPEALRIVDRARRYSAAGILAGEQEPSDLQALQDIQARAQAHRDWLERNDKAALNALLKIGETHPFGKSAEERARMKPVLWVPLDDEGFQRRSMGVKAEKAETETFRWFSNNERFGTGAQKLRPIAASDRIPSLVTNVTQFTCEVDDAEPTTGRPRLFRKSDREPVIVPRPMERTLRETSAGWTVPARVRVTTNGLEATWLGKPREPKGGSGRLRSGGGSGVAGGRRPDSADLEGGLLEAVQPEKGHRFATTDKGGRVYIPAELAERLAHLPKDTRVRFETVPSHRAPRVVFIRKE